jgi:CheY-like chemotaxis protein
VVRGEQDPSADGQTGPGRYDSSSFDAASVLADDLKNPLAVVIANLQLLADLVTSVQAGASIEGGLRPDAGEWLTTRMGEADNCLSDAHAAIERIREIVAPKKSLRQSASNRAPSLRKEVFRSARILIVDDEESLARVMHRIFRDYDAVVHTSAQHALDRITMGERFDVILSDVGMPGMSGCDLYDEIRRVAPGQAARMVFVTGGSDERGERALAATGQPVLMKPFGPKELRTFIEKFLG